MPPLGLASHLQQGREMMPSTLVTPTPVFSSFSSPTASTDQAALLLSQMSHRVQVQLLAWVRCNHSSRPGIHSRTHNSPVPCSAFVSQRVKHGAFAAHATLALGLQMLILIFLLPWKGVIDTAAAMQSAGSMSKQQPQFNPDVVLKYVRSRTCGNPMTCSSWCC